MTSQVPETINHDDRTLYANSELLLDAYLQSLPKTTRPTFALSSTNCWRGYVGTWEIADSVLWLTLIEGQLTDGAPASVKSVFPAAMDRQRADWVTGILECRERVPTTDERDAITGTQAQFQTVLIDVEAGRVKGEAIVNKGRPPPPRPQQRVLAPAQKPSAFVEWLHTSAAPRMPWLRRLIGYPLQYSMPKIEFVKDVSTVSPESSVVPREVIEAYRNTDYVIKFADGNQTLNVGDTAPVAEWLARFDRRFKHSTCAVITACNPFGEQISELENRHRTDDLRDWLECRQEASDDETDEEFPPIAYVEAIGIGRDSKWPAESSLAIFGLDRDGAVWLAKTYQQNAFVFAQLDCVQLVLLR